MSETIKITIDGIEVTATAGQTIVEAAEAAGIYIPQLCRYKGLVPHGSCRVCTVLANGRYQAACTQPVADGLVVESDTDELNRFRCDLVQMLFAEENHFCPACEKSGNCELQAMGYRLGIPAPRFPYLWPKREIDASHDKIFIDRNRCILCGRCVTASTDLDGKNVFEFVGRGSDKRVAVNAEANLAETDISVTDKAVEVCPVGAILVKRVGYAIPVGRRRYDKAPIGSDVETNR